MIQFNLLPDVKLEYIKAQRVRSIVLSVSIILSIAAIAMLLVLLSIVGLQKKHLNDVKRDVATETTTLQNKPNIGTILTVQNQLESLTALHNGKPAADRLFNYLNELTPASVSITNMSFDFTEYSVTITGTSDALSDVNQFVDTLKLTNFTSNENSTQSSAFSDVVLTDFGLNTSAQNPADEANYTITFDYNKSIFDNTQTIKLEVPTVTTRAQLQNPTDLFQATSTPGGQ